MRTVSTIILAVVSAAVLTLTGCGTYTPKGEPVAPNPAYVALNKRIEARQACYADNGCESYSAKDAGAATSVVGASNKGNK
jgi:hypothetical protein